MYQLLVAEAVAELALIIRPSLGGVYNKCGLCMHEETIAASML